MNFSKKGNVGGEQRVFAKSDWRGQFPFRKKNWAGEGMTFLREEMEGWAMIFCKIGLAEPMLFPQRIFLSFFYHKLTPTP